MSQLIFVPIDVTGGVKYYVVMVKRGGNNRSVAEVVQKDERTLVRMNKHHHYVDNIEIARTYIEAVLALEE